MWRAREGINTSGDRKDVGWLGYISCEGREIGGDGCRVVGRCFGSGARDRVSKGSEGPIRRLFIQLLHVST